MWQDRESRPHWISTNCTLCMQRCGRKDHGESAALQIRALLKPSCEAAVYLKTTGEKPPTWNLSGLEVVRMSVLYPQDDIFRSVESTRVSALTQTKSTTYSSTVTFHGLLACPWSHLCQHTRLAKAVLQHMHQPQIFYLTLTFYLLENCGGGYCFGMA